MVAGIFFSKMIIYSSFVHKLKVIKFDEVYKYVYW